MEQLTTLKTKVMSNTDGEDKQRIKAKQILTEAIGKDCVFTIDGIMWNVGNLNVNTIVDSMLKYVDQELASLREQLATEQDMRSTAEFANRMIIKDLNEKLKQKEDENRELVNFLLAIPIDPVYWVEYGSLIRKHKKNLSA